MLPKALYCAVAIDSSCASHCNFNLAAAGRKQSQCFLVTSHSPATYINNDLLACVTTVFIMLMLPSTANATHI